MKDWIEDVRDGREEGIVVKNECTSGLEWKPRSASALCCPG
jgi:hypothetical protein